MPQPLCRFGDWKIFSEFFPHRSSRLRCPLSTKYIKYLFNIRILFIDMHSLVVFVSIYVCAYVFEHLCVFTIISCCFKTVNTFLKKKECSSVKVKYTYNRIRLQLNSKRGVVSRIQKLILFPRYKTFYGRFPVARNILHLCIWAFAITSLLNITVQHFF